MLILSFKLLPTKSFMLGKEYTVGNFATTNIHSSESDPEGHRETTKLIFTLRLILRQAIVGGSFQRPKSHLRPFSLLCYPSLVAWGISSLLFSHLPLFFSFSFISLHGILIPAAAVHHRNGLWYLSLSLVSLVSSDECHLTLHFPLHFWMEWKACVRPGLQRKGLFR